MITDELLKRTNEVKGVTASVRDATLVLNKINDIFDMLETLKKHVENEAENFNYLIAKVEHSPELENALGRSELAIEVLDIIKNGLTERT